LKRAPRVKYNPTGNPKQKDWGRGKAHYERGKRGKKGEEERFSHHEEGTQADVGWGGMGGGLGAHGKKLTKKARGRGLHNSKGLIDENG